MPTGSSGTRLLDGRHGRRRDRGWTLRALSLSLSLSVAFVHCLVPLFWEQPRISTFQSLLCMMQLMLVGIWFGLRCASSSFFIMFKVQLQSHCVQFSLFCACRRSRWVCAVQFSSARPVSVPFGFRACLRLLTRLSWTSALLAVGITPTTTAGFSKGLPALSTEFTGGPVHFRGRPSRRAATELISTPWPLECAVLLAPLRSVQFSSAQLRSQMHPLADAKASLQINLHSSELSRTLPLRSFVQAKKKPKHQFSCFM